MSTLPKWVAKGNKVKFIYNGNWNCEGTIVSWEGSIDIRIAMKDVVVNNDKHPTRTFNLLSIKSPSLLTK
jgi:hypothetical protein